MELSQLGDVAVAHSCFSELACILPETVIPAKEKAFLYVFLFQQLCENILSSAVLTKGFLEWCRKIRKHVKDVYVLSAREISVFNTNGDILSASLIYVSVIE